MIAILAATVLATRLGAEDAVAYDQYKSGRPRRVVAFYTVGDGTGDVRLLRLPDNDRGNGRVLDGIPEIFGTHYIGRNPCGPDSAIYLGHWNGEEYRLDDRHYVAYANRINEYSVPLDPAKHYVIHRYGNARVLLDGKPVGKRVTPTPGCHVFSLKGAKGAWAFLEERP